MGFLKKVKSIFKSPKRESNNSNEPYPDRQLRCPEARGSEFYREFIESSPARPTCNPDPFITMMLREEARARMGVSGYLSNQGELFEGELIQRIVDINYRALQEATADDDAWSLENVAVAVSEADGDDIVGTNFPWPEDPPTPPFSLDAEPSVAPEAASPPFSWADGDDTPEHFNVISAVPLADVEPVDSRSGSVSSASLNSGDSSTSFKSEPSPTFSTHAQQQSRRKSV